MAANESDTASVEIDEEAMQKSRFCMEFTVDEGRLGDESNQDVRNFVQHSELQESKQLLNSNDVRNLTSWSQFSVFQNEVYFFDPFSFPSNVVKLTVHQPGSGKPTEVEPIECIESFWVKALCITRKNYVACLMLIPRETSEKNSSRSIYEGRDATEETYSYKLMLTEFNLITRLQVSSNYLCKMTEEAAQSAKFTLIGLTQEESPSVKLLLVDHNKSIVCIFKRESGSSFTEKIWNVQQIYVLFSHNIQTQQNFEHNRETLTRLMDRQNKIDDSNANPGLRRQDQTGLPKASHSSDQPELLSYDFSFASKIAVATYSSFATIYSICNDAQTGDDDASTYDPLDFKLFKRSVIHPRAHCSFSCCAISTRQFFIVSSLNTLTESAFFDLFDVYGKRLQGVFQRLQNPKVLPSHSKTNSSFALLEHEQNNEMQLIYEPADGGELRIDVLRFPNKVSPLNLDNVSEATQLSGLADPAQSVDDHEDREVVIEYNSLFAKGDTNTPSVSVVWNCKDHFTFLDWGNNKIKRILKRSENLNPNSLEVLYSRHLGPKNDENINITGFCVWDNQLMIVVEDNCMLKVVDTSKKAELYSLQFTKRRPKLLAYLSFAIPVGGNTLTVTFTNGKSLYDIACSRDQKEWRVCEEHKLPKDYYIVDVTFDKPSSRLAVAWRNLRSKHSEIVLLHRFDESLLFLSKIQLPETSYITGLTLRRSICCASIIRPEDGVVTCFYNVKTCKEIANSKNQVQTASVLTYYSTENPDRVNFCRHANSLDGKMCIMRFKRSYIN